MGNPSSLFHARLTIHGRAREKSVAARIAYVAGTRVKDDYTQTFHDNRGKLGVLRVGVFGFESSFQGLASAIDAAERRRDSNTCRELVVGLPHLLPEKTQIEAMKEIAFAINERWGVVGVAALHEPSSKGDLRNDHVHFVFSTREFKDGKFGRKTRQLDVLPRGRTEVAWLREVVSVAICRALRSVGREAECPRWDHRSYAARGISKCPGKHDGPIRRRIMRERKLEEAARIVGELTNQEKQSLDQLERGLDGPNPKTITPPSVASPQRADMDFCADDWERRFKLLSPEDSKKTTALDSGIAEMDLDKLERLASKMPRKTPEHSSPDHEIPG